MTLERQLKLALGVAVTFLVGCFIALYHSEHQSTTICGTNPCLVKMPNNGKDGLKIMDSRGPLVDNPFVIVDHNNAPMFWVNVGGAFSGAQPICVTALNVMAPDPICMMPNGSLRLNGATLTAGDIRWLHRQRATK